MSKLQATIQARRDRLRLAGLLFCPQESSECEKAEQERPAFVMSTLFVHKSTLANPLGLRLLHLDHHR